jgi:hypothetical protein
MPRTRLCSGEFTESLPCPASTILGTTNFEESSEGADKLKAILDVGTDPVDLHDRRVRRNDL